MNLGSTGLSELLRDSEYWKQCANSYLDADDARAGLIVMVPFIVKAHLRGGASLTQQISSELTVGSLSKKVSSAPQCLSSPSDQPRGILGVFVTGVQGLSSGPASRAGVCEAAPPFT